MTDAEPDAPLEGVRVVDLSQNLAGPYATQILADLGADVVKVEPPGGDPARAWGPPFHEGTSPLFLCANRGKRSVTLDLREEQDREVLRRLAGGADVFVQAFRAGVAESLGFDEAAVRALRPDVVYVSVTAFGVDGPRREEPGYDPLMQAYAGVMSVTGEADGPPVRVGTSLVDFGTGMWTALAVLAALRSRERTGEGCHVTTSLLDTAVAWMAYHLQGHAATGAVPGRHGTGIGMIAPYEAFPCADSRLMIAAGNDAAFRRLCAALDMQEAARDPRFATNPDRVAHREELVERVAERTRPLTRKALETRLREASVPCAPIHDVGEVAADPQVLASGMLRDLPGAAAGYLDVAAPFLRDGRRPEARDAPPTPGEHTDEIRREVGLPGGSG